MDYFIFYRGSFEVFMESRFARWGKCYPVTHFSPDILKIIKTGMNVVMEIIHVKSLLKAMVIHLTLQFFLK
jgi:hypothetical protein